MRPLFAIAVLSFGMILSRVDGFLDVLSYLDRCRSENFDECLKHDLTQTIDDIMNKTETYRINQYLTVTVTASHHRPVNYSSYRDNGRSGNLSTRILDFFNAMKVQYQPEAIDQLTEDVFEGRKKKKGNKKHKMGMMMGIASLLMSLMSGMFLKMKLIIVKMLALKALIVAKIALALASVVALKKLGGGGGTVVQPVWSGSSGGGTDHGGYSRSYEYANEEQKRMSTANALAYKAQLDSYDMHNNSEAQKPL